MASTTTRPQYILLLLFVVNLILAFVTQFEFARFNRLFPNLNVIYSLVPVRHMYPTLSGTCSGDGCPDISKLRKAVEDVTEYDVFTALQISKYKMGCYGDLDAMKNADDYQTFQGYNADLRADHLNEAQYNAGGFASQSACKCVDDLVKGLSSVDWTAKYATVGDAAQAAGLTATYDGALGSANLNLDPATDFNDVIASAVKTEIPRYVVEFCSASGVPQMTYKYEGVTDTPLLALVGQLLIVLGIALEYIMRWQAENSNTDASKKQSTYQSVFAFLLSLLSAAIFVLLFVWYPDNLKTDDSAYVGYRTDKYTKVERLGQVLMLGVFLFVIVNTVVQLLVGGLAMRRNKEKDKDHNIFGGYSMLFAYDMQQTLGWALLILSFAIDTNVKHLDTLATFVIIVAGAGALQYFSNMLKTVYNKTLVHTSQDDIATLQTMVEPGEKITNFEGELKDRMDPKRHTHLKHLRNFLRFIGFGRLLIFISVAVLVIFSVTLARESTVGSHTQSLYEGRLLYALLAFFIGTVGVDVVLELVPLQFIYLSDASGEKHLTDAYAYNVRYYFISAYFLWLNLSNVTLFQYETDKHWSN